MFGRLDVGASAYRVGPRWEGLDGDEITYNFQSVTHFLVIPGPATFRCRWLPLLVGFSTGRGCFLGFYDPGDGRAYQVPGYLSKVPFFRAPDELSSIIREESYLWHRSLSIERARESLLALGIGINEDNFADRVSNGDEDAAENFLRIGYSPDTRDAHGIPVVCLAARNGHRHIIETLLSRNVDVNVLSDDRGNSPLMEAAVRGDATSTRRLLEAGADPDLISKSGQSALMMAVGEHRTEIVQILMEHGAGLSFVDSLGMTARKYAEIFNNREILEILDRKPAS